MFLLSLFCIFVAAIGGTTAKIEGWDTSPNTQYHIQTDEGPERYFRYQTISGQYRKEKRLEDGTVVGAYGWVDADGYLRLNDYIADNEGYRVVRTKRLYVGSQSAENPKYESQVGNINSISSSLYKEPIRKISNYYPEDNSKALVFPSTPPSLSFLRKSPTPPSAYYPSSTPSPVKQVEITPSPFRYTTTEEPYRGYSKFNSGYRYTTTEEPYRGYSKLNSGYRDTKYSQRRHDTDDSYNGVAISNNGFQYYLPRHYHEEESQPGDKRVGSFGYIDPFGIRRVVYYNASPESGFVHKKNNRYVGFDSTPYDPRP